MCYNVARTLRDSRQTDAWPAPLESRVEIQIYIRCICMHGNRYWEIVGWGVLISLLLTGCAESDSRETYVVYIYF